MAETGLRVVITQDQQVVADVTVNGPHLLIGSGGHCDVRLGPDLLAIEQVRLAVEDGQVWATALARTPSVFLDGRPFSSGPVTPSDALSVGRLFIQVVAWQEQVQKNPGHKRFIPLALLLVVLAALAVMGGVSRKPASAGALPEPPKSPFAENEAAPVCPESNAASALVAAGDLWREGVDARERSPFSPRNGLEAVRLFNTAGSCFDTAGKRDSGDEARTQASMLRTALEKSFHVHHVRLSHAITQQDFSLCQGEVAVLKGFMTGRDHPYMTWLDNLERWLEVTQGTRQSS